MTNGLGRKTKAGSWVCFREAIKSKSLYDVPPESQQDAPVVAQSPSVLSGLSAIIDFCR